MTRPDQPDFLIIGAPKAGTTALHAALAQHPGRLHVLAQGAEVLAVRRRAAARLARARATSTPSRSGSGGATTTSALFAPAPAHVQVRGESTPFYLWSRGAHRRIAEALPDVRLIAVVRDPIDRAYSNWMHLWSDGLEPVADFEAAFALAGRADRRRAGRRSGATASSGGTASSSRTCSATSTPSACSCCATATSSTSPRATVDRACRFLGHPRGPRRRRSRATTAAASSQPGLAAAVLGPVVRGGRPGRAVRAAAGVAAGQRAARSAG